MKQKRMVKSNEIGVRIKRRRRELKMSQEELAERLDVTYQQVQRYENGMNKLNVENIQLIADTLSVPVSYFFEPADKMFVAAEEPPPYLPADENKLLKHFRKIKNDGSKDIVIQVARLAAKTSN
ncbi:MAG: helix-turn-helix transcriptional regulator [Deltaproteobacteria bacterium]|nr:helix-turn-helix transcriptional regulator [Deltaproteobacteria bacterium]